MPRPTVALWMYQDLGGDLITKKLSRTLQSQGIEVISNFDLRKSMLYEGNVWTEDERCLSEVDVLYQMNADDQSPFQNNLLQILELQGVSVINSMRSFNQAKDKLLTNTLLRQANIPVPLAIGLDQNQLSAQIAALTENWPSILMKPRGLHGGKGIVKWGNFDHLKDGWQLISQRADQFYLESYIPFGEHDFRVEVINGKIAGCYSRQKAHSFKTNISAEGGLMGINCPDFCKDIALQAVQLLGLDCSIVDMVMHKYTGEYYILEVNPALGVFNEAAIAKGVPIFHRGNESYKNDDLKLSLLQKLIIQKLKKSFNGYRNRKMSTNTVLSGNI